MTWWLAVLLGSSALAADEEGAVALEAYADRRLEIVDREVTTVYSRAYDGSGRFWFVQEGERRLLTAPQLAELVGDEAEASRLRSRRAVGMFGGVACLVVGGIAGSIGLLSINPQLEQPEWIMPTGLALGGAGIVAGPLVLSLGVRSHHPSTLYSRDEATRHVEAYNATLRDELLGD